MPIHRKLFLAHAGELAFRLVSTFGRTPGTSGLVTQFLRSYARRWNRPGLLSNLLRAADMDSVITREALLMAAVDIRPRLPRAFAQSRGYRRDAEDAALTDAFFAEFLASLGRALEWRPSEARAEAEAFRRDLAMYERWTKRSPLRSRKGEESPFPDRCALLLDPAMMEQARRAAAEFEQEILRATARIFTRLGSEPRQKSRRAAKPFRRPARRSRPGAKLPRRAASKTKKKLRKRALRKPRRRKPASRPRRPAAHRRRHRRRHRR